MFLNNSPFSEFQTTIFKPFSDITKDQDSVCTGYTELERTTLLSNLGLEALADKITNAHELEHHFWGQSLVRKMCEFCNYSLFPAWSVALGSLTSYALFDGANMDTMLHSNGVHNWPESSIDVISYFTIINTFIATLLSKASALGDPLSALALTTEQYELISIISDRLYAIKENDPTAEEIALALPEEDSEHYDERFNMALILLAGKFKVHLHTTQLNNTQTLQRYLTKLKMGEGNTDSDREENKSFSFRTEDEGVSLTDADIIADEIKANDNYSEDSREEHLSNSIKHAIFVDIDVNDRSSLENDTSISLNFICTRHHNKAHNKLTFALSDALLHTLLIQTAAFIFELNKIINACFDFFKQQGWLDTKNLELNSVSNIITFIILLMLTFWAAISRGFNNNSLKSIKTITEINKFIYEWQTTSIKDMFSHMLSKMTCQKFLTWCRSPNVINDIYNNASLAAGIFVASINVAYYVLLAYYVGTEGFEHTANILGEIFGVDSAPSWLANGIWQPLLSLVFSAQIINQLLLTVSTSSKKVLLFTKEWPKLTDQDTLFCVYLFPLALNSITFGVTGYLTANKHFSNEWSIGFAICSAIANGCFSYAVADENYKAFRSLTREGYDNLAAKTKQWASYFNQESTDEAHGDEEMKSQTDDSDSLKKPLLQEGSAFDNYRGIFNNNVNAENNSGGKLLYNELK